MKSVEIIPPEGYEIDKKNYTFEEIKFKPIEYLTLSGITSKINGQYVDIDVKTMAFNLLLQIAAYYNGNWEPNWCNINERKYYIYMCEGKYFVATCITTPACFIHFKNKADAQAVINNPNFLTIINKLYKYYE